MTIPSLTDPRQAVATRRRLDPPSTLPPEPANGLTHDTAYHLRGPLTKIQESVRLVRDGNLGTINRDQRACLSAAIEQCDGLDEKLGAMVLEPRHGGVPPANRRWVSVQEMRRAVDRAARPWLLPRQVTLLWDGTDEPNLSLFADPQALRRLIVNLVVNSIRVTETRGSVLIRLAPLRSGEAVRLSVIDQGSGISEAQLRQIARRQSFGEAAGGQGLMICRQLAALHFSSLRIRSRLGTGTEVGLDLPTAGPRCVAARWADWRVAQRTPSKRAPHHVATGHRDLIQRSRPERTGHRARLDPPSVLVELPPLQTRPRCEDRLVAGTVTLGAATARSTAEAFNRVLQKQQRLFDLIYRIEDRCWVWIVDSDLRNAETELARIAEAAETELENLRLSWSQPQAIPIDERRTVAQVSDLLVRQTLSRSTSRSINDHDQVRLGTTSIPASPVAANRLDRELRQISGRMHRQIGNLREQSQRIRPPAT